jgi:hypothetical protein
MRMVVPLLLVAIREEAPAKAWYQLSLIQDLPGASS